MKLLLISLVLTFFRNCLFRALADQLYGNSKAIGGYHLKLRRETVNYIRLHRQDFEPFVDEDVTFDRHCELLEQDGTYAGEGPSTNYVTQHSGDLNSELVLYLDHGNLFDPLYCLLLKCPVTW